jgi:hypothetical protein
MRKGDVIDYSGWYGVEVGLSVVATGSRSRTMTTGL